MPLISENSLFIHIPKTGGTSIESCFNLACGNNFYCADPNENIEYKKKVLFGSININGLIYELQHLKHKEIIDLELICIKKLDKLFSFSFVRNPWDKMISEYFWIGKKYFSSFLSYLKFITYGEPLPDLINYSDPTYGSEDYFLWYLKYNHLYPQSDFIVNDDKLLVDFVGRFENLQEDFDVICDQIKLPRIKLPIKNKTNHKHYVEYYDNETRNIVAKKYAKDIEYFKYKFAG